MIGEIDLLYLRGVKIVVTVWRFEKDYLIPLYPPLSKGGNVSPPFEKGRWEGFWSAISNS